MIPLVGRKRGRPKAPPPRPRSEDDQERDHRSRRRRQDAHSAPEATETVARPAGFEIDQRAHSAPPVSRARGSLVAAAFVHWASSREFHLRHGSLPQPPPLYGDAGSSPAHKR